MDDQEGDPRARWLLSPDQKKIKRTRTEVVFSAMIVDLEKQIRHILGLREDDFWGLFLARGHKCADTRTHAHTYTPN